MRWHCAAARAARAVAHRRFAPDYWRRHLLPVHRQRSSEGSNKVTNVFHRKQVFLKPFTNATKPTHLCYNTKMKPFFPYSLRGALVAFIIFLPRIPPLNTFSAENLFPFVDYLHGFLGIGSAGHIALDFIYKFQAKYPINIEDARSLLNIFIVVEYTALGTLLGFLYSFIPKTNGKKTDSLRSLV
jgi:hypothetical protein